MVSEGDVSFPHWRVANLLVCMVIFLASGHSWVACECFGELPRGFDPVFGVKRILGVGDINAIGVGAKGRWRFLTIGHGGVSQLFTIATWKRLTDGSLFCNFSPRNCVEGQRYQLSPLCTFLFGLSAAATAFRYALNFSDCCIHLGGVGGLFDVNLLAFICSQLIPEFQISSSFPKS